jgi:PadR family transcriptional regulator PadR
MKLSKELVKGSTAMLVMSVMRGQDMYGYQIIKAIANRSEHVFDMKEGTLYPILHSLEEEGLLESYWEGEGRKRKYYHLTQKGVTELERQAKEFQVFSGAVQKVLGGESFAY